MDKILIANRGEIARRVMSTCHRLGIDTVVVYSEADKDLPYVKEATEAYSIGESPAPKSYMNQTKILQIAKEAHVSAIHPGYGFLSENASFIKRVESSNMIFIGPTSEVVALMGDKIKARQTMIDAGVPVVPGSNDAVDVETAAHIASDIGYPVMLKASAGGGGIGMQKCHNEAELRQAFKSNQGRAQAYFGDSSMFVEKYIENGRHIEVQIFADDQGHVVHLFERDCSVQRRHQKVIEETPSPFLTAKTRKQMTDAAVKAALFVNYTNAGTVEFIVDQNENFYFLEMNTRLQVEHPVTESVTDTDLVEWQIRVAEGKSLPKSQSELTTRGHSIEFRLYAEDPVTFYPSPGTITEFNYPSIDGVRVDTGYESGNQITPFYDPMIAKIIVSDSNRENAIAKAHAFFSEFEVSGIKTNIPLFRKLLEQSSFKEGNYTTTLLQK